VNIYQVNLGYVVYGGADTLYVVAETEEQAAEYAKKDSPDTFGKKSDKIFCIKIDLEVPGVFEAHGNDY